MKKLLFLLLIMGITLNAHAGLIDITVLSSDSQVSYSYFNTAYNTIKNEFNGNIESVNIKDATITVADMATSASPAQREGDHFNAYTKSGMLPADSADLTSDISAGVSYVKTDAGLMYRVAISSTSKTYTASKDTWVYIDTNGTLQYVEVAVGAAQPTTPSNSLLLATVTTDGVEITGVTDRRTTAISLGSTEDFYIKGMALLWDSATDRMSVDAGVVRVGTTTVSKSSITGLDLDTDADYLDGGAAGDRNVSKWLHIYCDDTGSVKFEDANPDYHDTSGNTAGKKYYYKNGTDYWRYIGSIYLNATGSGNITGFKWFGDGDTATVMRGTPLSLTTTASNSAWSAALSCAAGMPPASTLGIFGLENAKTADNTVLLIRPNGQNGLPWSTNPGDGFDAYNRGGGQRWSMTDDSQQIQYQTGNNNPDSMEITLEGFVLTR